MRTVHILRTVRTVHIVRLVGTVHFFEIGEHSEQFWSNSTELWFQLNLVKDTMNLRPANFMHFYPWTMTLKLDKDKFYLTNNIYSRHPD